MLADKCFYYVSAVVTFEQLPTVTVYTDRWWKSIMSPSHRVSRPFPKIIEKTILVICKRTKKKKWEREKRCVSLAEQWQVQISAFWSDDYKWRSTQHYITEGRQCCCCCNGTEPSQTKSKHYLHTCHGTVRWQMYSQTASRITTSL